MKKLMAFLLVFSFAFGFSGIGTVMAYDVYFYVDSAPNAYGSPDWAPWWSQTKEDVVAGTFVNMRTGHFPGTTKADPYDEIVYSTMDLGKRLHWIYWIPGETTSNLADNFEVKWVIDWDGTDYTYDWSTYSLVENGEEIGWVQPGSWENYDDGQGNSGVIGSLGFAWWATDDEAEPFDTGGSPYDETDQADIDALRSIALQYQTYAIGMYRNPSGEEFGQLQVNIAPVPVPAAVWLLGSGLIGLVGLRRKFGR